MAEHPKDSEVKGLHEVILPAKRFAALSDIILARDSSPEINDNGIEVTETEWSSDTDNALYRLVKVHDIYEADPDYYLEVYDDGEDPTLRQTYYAGGDSPNWIVDVDTTGTNDPTYDNDAATLVLSVLQNQLPEAFTDHLYNIYDEAYWELVGAYVMDDPEIEKELEKILLASPAKLREAQINGVVSAALQKFDHRIRSVVSEATNNGPYTELGIKIIQKDYKKFYAPFAQTAFKIFAEGEGRLRNIPKKNL